jgi:hypothetical protein
MTLGVDSLLSATAKGGGTEAMLLKRLRAKDFRNAPELTPEDQKLVADVHRLISEGHIGKHTLNKVKKAFEQTTDPVEMVAILRKEIARQYLLGVTPKTGANTPPDPRELILSSYSHLVGVVEFPLTEERTTPAPDGATPPYSRRG